MLAGKVKLSTFVTIVALFAAIGVLANLLLQGPPEDNIEHKRDGPPPSVLAKQKNEQNRAAYEKEKENEAAAVSSDAPENERIAALNKLRPVDRFLIKKQGLDLGQTKLKDVTKGEVYKVNLYQDEGASTINRAKIDLDRDDHWDEKWTFSDDGIKRQVAPSDDDDFSQEFIWNGTDWVDLT